MEAFDNELHEHLKDSDVRSAKLLLMPNTGIAADHVIKNH